jgi:DNA adenine methylase
MLPKQKPFLRWVGGKQRLVKTLLAHLPQHVRDGDQDYTYYEPFLGAGSLLLGLQPGTAVVGDVNEELINTYQVLQEVPSQLPELQQQLQILPNDEDTYYLVRDEWELDTLSPLQRATRFIYLNRTCYAGLYRENRSGVFNVSYGKNPTARVDSMADIEPVAKYLQREDVSVTVMRADFRETVAAAEEGDFVYLDPPYYPLTNTTFTSYHKGSGFDYDGLYNTFMDLTDRGCYVLMSESDCPHNREVYADYILGELSLGKTIRPDMTTNRRELLISNYQLDE